MAKTTAPLFSMVASGQFGHTVTYDKRGFARKYVIPANPQSALQMAIRNKLGDIQRELYWLGADLRGHAPSDLGYHWNALIIKQILDNDAAYWVAKKAEWDAFAAGNKTDWATKDEAIGLVNTDGMCFYIVAHAYYDVSFALTGSGRITHPGETTSATNNTEWKAAA